MLKEIIKLLSQKRIVYITDPSKVDYKFEGKHLKIFNEKISYQEILGVIFLQKAKSKPRTKKVPIVFPPFELLNIKTYPYKKDRYMLFNQICHYVGRYLQTYLKRYLGRRTFGGLRRVLSFCGYRKVVRENSVFAPIYADCDSIKDGRLLFQRLSFYMKDAYTTSYGFYGILTIYTGILIAYHLGKKLPSDTQILASIFLPAAYSLVHMLHIRAETFDMQDYSKIPLRGQVYIFLNEFTNNEAFLEHFLYSLELLE